jgi:predicted transcriptional regulator
MKVIHLRVDDDIDEQLRDLADQERETVPTLVRRYVRRGLKADGRDVDSSRAHEGTGRVR